MEAYKEFRKEALELASKWELFKPYNGCTKLYLKFMYRTRLSCKVLKKLKAYKKEIPVIEAVEIIIELDNRIEAIKYNKK